MPAKKLFCLLLKVYYIIIFFIVISLFNLSAFSVERVEFVRQLSGKNLKSVIFTSTDPQGYLYVLNEKEHRVQVLDPTGNTDRSFGEKGDKSGYLQEPSRLIIDQDNNIYVLDTGNNRVQVFDSSGNFLNKFGKNYI